MARSNGNTYIHHAESHGCNVKYGKGDHAKIYPPGTYNGPISMLIVPTNLKGNGTEHSIIKTLLKWGIPIAVIATILYGIYEAVQFLESL